MWKKRTPDYDVKRELEAEYVALLGPARFAELRTMVEVLIEHGHASD